MNKITAKDTKDLSKGSIGKTILYFSLPIFLSQLFQQLYNTADTWLVGKFIDTNALAAVSSSGTLIFTLVSFFTGASAGAGVVISKYFGADDKDNMTKAIYTNLAFSLVSGILLSIFGVIFTPFLLRLIDTPENIMPQAVEYFRYYFFGIVAMTMYNACRSIMNALGDSKNPLYYLIFSSLLNVALDCLFMGPFGLGVGSAAVATVISQAASVVLCLIHLTRKGRLYTISLKYIRFYKKSFIEIFKYGIPAGIQNSVIGIANVVVQSKINSYGEFAVAAYGIHAKIEGFAFLPVNSFTMAISTFVGQNLGAKEYDRAKKGGSFGILSGVILTEAIGITTFLLAKYLVAFFDDTPEVIELGVRQAQTVALFYGLLAFSHCVAAVCRGAGKAVIPMSVMLAVWCVFRIIYIETVSIIFPGEIGYVYWAYPITWGISSIIYLFYYLFSDWVHGLDCKSKKQIIAEETQAAAEEELQTSDDLN